MEIQNDIDKSLYLTVIKKGVLLLKSKKHYNQVVILNKLRHLGIEMSTPSFSNMLNDKKIGDVILYKTYEAIQHIIHHELGLQWDGAEYVGEKVDPDWQPTIVSELSLNEPSIVSKPGFAFHEGGRLTLRDQVSFFSTAQKEVIEFGATLNTFASNFVSRSDPEFKSPVEQLLNNGVNFKCYLLDPDCNEARLYFQDRERAQKGEKERLEKTKKTIQELNSLKKEFSAAGYKGSLEIFTYKHIPYNYFLAVDGSTINGKMAVSHYIYGEPRAKSPVISFTKNTNHSLYKRYWASLQKLMVDAKRIES